MTDALDEIFSALSHPDRRRIVRILARGEESTVGEIAEGFEVSLNQVSKHLKILERAGLVRRRIVGREHRCSLDPAPLVRARSWLEEYRRFWTQSLEGLEAHLASAPEPDEEEDDDG